MKGKIILSFILALIALGVIGFLGQRGLESMIGSIEEASRPNEKIAGLNEIMQSLSEAESSVRSYIITRDQSDLSPFKESAATINIKLDHLKSITYDSLQLTRLDRLDQVIGKKYEVLSSLINVRNEQGGSVLKKVMDDIEKLKDEARAETTEEEGARQNPEVYTRMFGEKPTKEDSAAMDARIQSLEVDKAIDRIDREETRNSRQLLEQELSLTEEDNAHMARIRQIMAEIENTELEQTIDRAEMVRNTSEKTINTITTVLVIALFVFAFLLSIIFNDIRRSRQRREQLRLAKDRAEKLARVKEDFLSNMSHEIRTPLNAIIGFTEQLGDSNLDSTQSKFLDRIKSSGDHLLRLINDILDYAKMESGKMELEKSGFRPRKEVNEVLALLSTAADRKGLTLRSEIRDDVPEVFIGDSVRFRQIMINLLNNSVKFTESGGILLSLNSVKEGELHMLHLAVKDTGIGIPHDKIETIFEDFSQADSSTARKYGGSGLGLSIVNKIARLHNGSVRVESEEGEGTTFHVKLLYQAGSENDLAETAKPRKVADLQGLRALVVDDQAYNLELLELILSRWNMRCETAANGREALALAKKHTFDIILLDIQMPGMSGLEVSEKLFSEQIITKETPVVALTAGTAEEDKKRARQAGMKFFLPKPFTQEQLKQVIVRACGVEYQESEPVIEPDTSGSDQLQLEGLLELANGDMQFVTNMLTIFRNNFASDSKELFEGVDNKDWDRVRSMAHKMVPPCGHLGYTSVAGRLKRIENEVKEGANAAKIQELADDIKRKSSGIIAEIDQKIDELDPNKQHV